MRWRNWLVAVLGLCAAPAQAAGFDVKEMARNLGVSEVRAGLFLHDVELKYGFPFALDYSTVNLANWQNLNTEVLFALPDADILHWLGSPRLGLSTSLNFAGKESYARLAAVWHVPVFETGIFVEPMLGGAIHNGYLENAPAGQRNLGCRFLYFYGANVGYEITDTMSAMVTVEHASHWAQCEPTANDGINRLGVRVGWKLN
ncbi:acyloxyacyl hydrolase [Mariluticola halotolerans]|uniref:acyloxyacyl hydrolase n=1 Tax=Mariluticola halotolerans TaxID=2909283 RepID=UPI0026E18AF7|nr:acyloxyacyl hydrolase [Mariluticola halotolerans]UJQ93653.1 acyloxyacyl hydrolase [Mariluticola halotolerans]